MAHWRSPRIQRLGRWLGHRGKKVLEFAVDRILPRSPASSLDAVRDVRRVLIVRPNFRVGQTLMTTPLVYALRERFPGARIDYLAGETVTPVLEGLPVDKVYAVSRKFLLYPWRFAALLLRLRRNRYDLAFAGLGGSFSGGLYAYLTGARFRLGCEGKAARFLNICLPPLAAAHPYDGPIEFARQIGARCPDKPVYRVMPEEAARARAVLSAAGFAVEGRPAPFVAVFIGGNQDAKEKTRWPIGNWIGLARALALDRVRFAVFLGYEERELEELFRREVGAVVPIWFSAPFRFFAALLAEAALAVTPNTGPMHLAAALGVPTVVLLQTPVFAGACPRGPDDRVLVQPTVAQAVAALKAHRLWPSVRRRADGADVAATASTTSLPPVTPREF